MPGRHKTNSNLSSKGRAESPGGRVSSGFPSDVMPCRPPHTHTHKGRYTPRDALYPPCGRTVPFAGNKWGEMAIKWGGFQSHTLTMHGGVVVVMGGGGGWILQAQAVLQWREVPSLVSNWWIHTKTGTVLMHRVVLEMDPC